MKTLAEKICKRKNTILLISLILMVLSFVGIKLTKINYDILVYLPEEIETVKGQKLLTDEFGMGAYTVVLSKNIPSKEILSLEEKFQKIDGVRKVFSIYDGLGTNIPLDFLPKEIIEHLHKENTDLLFVTFTESTSSLKTINAIREMKEISKDVQISGMSALVLDTMDLSESEILIYVVIAVVLCLLVLELSLDSYVVPILLLFNIGISILFNLGSNVIFGEISYITKALVAVLQLGVTTDFSIFLYHAYEKKKKNGLKNLEAMQEAIVDTFTSVTGSSLTTIAGFLVLVTMNLSLGKDLGLVMAKGVFLGVVCVLTLFPSLLLFFDRWIEKTKHKPIILPFEKLNFLVVKHHKKIFILFLILFIPTYLANSKVDVYYKIDKSLPNTLDSIVANNELKEKFNIVSPEIILYRKDLKTEVVEEMVKELEGLEGIDFVLSFSKLENLGLTKNMLPKELINVFESDHYQMMLVNSLYEIASEELNQQVGRVNNILSKYDTEAILAGEGPLMKDLVTISDEDFQNVNTSSIICILMIMLLVLKSFSLPILLILTIEFAIFFNMSISYFGGIVLPFVAPIVLGTIQLGATIDYAILMTTHYMQLRKSGLEKQKAMLNTLNYCNGSIFVSGMCFFAATFGVGVYSDLEMVGALCNLISRGAIISMVVVLTVLPSILLLFDSLILKTTYKKEVIKMKKTKKRIPAIFIMFLALVPLTVSALNKEETVYAKLNSDGTTKNIVVNEHLINKEGKQELVDYSDLENIINTNSHHTFSKDQTKLTWQSNGNSIFYQGTSTKELPVSATITYTLEGRKVSLEELIGKKGHVKIEIKYKNKLKFLHKINGKTEEIYTPFLVVMGTVFNNDSVSNLEIENGRVIDNGNKSIVVGLSSPGLYESFDLMELKNFDTITIQLNTEKFELPTIYSIMTPKLLEKSDISLLDKMSELYENVEKLQDSMNTIEDSSKKIVNGMETISLGSKEISKNLNLVFENLEKIKNGNLDLDKSLNLIIATLEKTKESIKNNPELEQVAKLIEGNKQLLAIQPDTQLALTNEALEKCYENLSNTTMLDTLLISLKKLESGASLLANGTKSLYNGVAVLNEKMGELAYGAKTLNKGMNDFNDGIKAFNKSGIHELSKMANKANDLTSKMNALVKLGNDYQTFTLKDKKIETNTKFVLVVDGVQIPKEETQKNQSKEKETFFDRIQSLFTK